MPSIIPDGAITSAPARAWLTACSASSGKRGVVVDVHPAAGFGQRAAMAVIGVLAEAQVGDHQQPGRRLPGDPDGLLDDPVVAERGRPPRILVLGDAEQEDRRDAQLGRLGHRLAQPVERELILPRHRRDLPPQALPVVDEQRVDQVIHGQPGLAQHLAESRMAAEPSGPVQRITGGGLE